MCPQLSRMITPPKPKMPAPVAPPPPPPIPAVPATPVQRQPDPPGTTPAAPSESPAAKEAAEKARVDGQRQRGRAATILTGNQGLVGTEMIARPTATRMLLGG